MKKLIKDEKCVLHKIPLLILRLFLPIVSISLTYVVYFLLNESKNKISMIDIDYLYNMLEHIVMSLTILICGSLLFDLAIKKSDIE